MRHFSTNFSASSLQFLFVDVITCHVARYKINPSIRNYALYRIKIAHTSMLIAIDNKLYESNLIRQSNKLRYEKLRETDRQEIWRRLCESGPRAGFQNFALLSLLH